MLASRAILPWAILGVTASAALGLALTPRPAQAEKLPVDCSGRVTTCKEFTKCIEFVNNKCGTVETIYWYWYR